MAEDRLACGKSRVPVHVLASGAPAVHDHVFRLAAAASGDTSHILGSFMKLRRSAGDLRACHDHQGISASANPGGSPEGADV
jgi:hypothetical protein